MMAKEITTDPAQRLDIYARPDRTFEKTLSFKNSDETAFDFTGYTISLIVRQYQGDQSILTFSNGSGLSISGGDVILSKTEEEFTLRRGKYLYELLVNNGSSLKTWLNGFVYVDDGVFDNIDETSTIQVIQSGDVVNITVSSGGAPLNLGDLAFLDFVGTSEITNEAVTNAKLANMTSGTMKGRLSSTGVPQNLTASQVKSILNFISNGFQSDDVFILIPDDGNTSFTIQMSNDETTYSPSIIFGDDSTFKITMSDGVTEIIGFSFNLNTGVLELTSTSPDKILFPQGANTTNTEGLINRLFVDNRTIGENSTGVIKLTKSSPSVYGETTARTGQLLIDLNGSFIGGSAIVHHNDSSAPQIVTDLDLLEHGNYVNDSLNQIFIYRSGSSTLSIAYTQPTLTEGTTDLTAPSILTPTIENGNEDKLIVPFDEAVNIQDVSGLSITGDATISIVSILSGNGTSTVTFTISPVAQAGQSLTLNVVVDNTITDLSSNSNALAPTNVAITNNVGIVQQLNTPTGFEAENLSPTSIRLIWNSVTDADNYVLQRGVLPDYSDAVAIYTGPLLTFDDSGLTEDTTYYYRVKAIDDVDNIYSDSNYATLNIVATDSIFSILQAEAGWYNFTNKTVGAFSQFVEEKGNYTTGNVSGSPEYISGTRLDFTRADNDVISLGSPFTFLKDSTDGFSIYLKFNPKTIGFIAYFLGQTETNHQVVVGFNASNQLQVFTKMNSTTVVINTVTDALFSGAGPYTAKHVFIDFVKATQEVKFYIDNATVAATKTANNLIGDISLYNPIEQWYLGARNVSGSADVANSGDGIFDHVIINNKLLTETEKQLIIDNA